MDRIYTIIQKEEMKRVSDEILASLDKLGKRKALTGEASTYSKQEIIACRTGQGRVDCFAD